MVELGLGEKIILLLGSAKPVLIPREYLTTYLLLLKKRGIDIPYFYWEDHGLPYSEDVSSTVFGLEYTGYIKTIREVKIPSENGIENIELGKDCIILTRKGEEEFLKIIEEDRKLYEEIKKEMEELIEYDKERLMRQLSATAKL